MFLKKNLITFGLLAAMAAMMASCTNEDLMYNPQLEEYTRAFIKEFGKIDPEQDWNMAQEANVTLNFGSRQAETVKVYAKHENKYYLVADLVQLSGQVTVPIDIPQTTTDLMVYVDGTSYYCKTNTQVNCETGGSRCQLIDSKSVTGGGSSRTTVKGGDETYKAGDYKISVTQLSDDKDLIFNAQQISPITSVDMWSTYYSLYTNAWYKNTLGVKGILPERGFPNSVENAKELIDASVLNSNSFKLYEDFVFDLDGTDGTLTIYPYFYGTPDVHVLGLYFLSEDGYPIDTDGNKITTIDETTKDKVMKFPIYMDAQGDDIHISPHPVYDIESINCEVTEVNLFPYDTFDLEPYLYIVGYDKNSNKVTLRNSDLLSNYTTRFSFIKTEYGYYDGSWHQYGDYDWPCGKYGLLEGTSAAEGHTNNFEIHALGYNTTTGMETKTSYLRTTTDPKVTVNVVSSSEEHNYTLNYFPVEKISYSDNYNDSDGSFVARLRNPQYFKTNYWNGNEGHYSFFDTENTTNSDFSTACDNFKNNLTDNISNDLLTFFIDSWGCNFPCPDLDEWKVDIVQENGADKIDAHNWWWIEVYLKFTPKSGSNSAPRRNTSSRSNFVYNEAVDPYDPNLFLDKTNLERCGWIDINNVYDDYRMYGEGSSSYYTQFPMLVKTKGYTITLTNGSTPYTGKVGMYIDTFRSGFKPESGYSKYSDLFTLMKTDAKKYYEHTFYSQSQLNRYKYSTAELTNATRSSRDEEDTSTDTDTYFDYVYAYAYTHPTTGDMFFSFEDWYITHPSTKDISVDGNYNGYSYGDYSYDSDGEGTGDYNSDRDFNDLIYRMYSNVKVASSEIVELVEEETNDEGFPWIWALEDLGSTDDFDFNDVVIRITSITTNKKVVSNTYDSEGNVTSSEKISSETIKKVKFTPLAAGGTLPIYIHFHDGTNDYVLEPGSFDLTSSGDRPVGAEFHEWFGISDSSIMINTDNNANLATRTTKVADSNIKSCTLIVNNSFSIYWGDSQVSITSAGTLDAVKQSTLYVTVNGIDADEDATLFTDIDKEKATTYKIGTPYKGGAPQSFIIASETWKWPTERTHITTAYPKFANWVEDGSNNTDWYSEAYKNGDTTVFNP